MLVAGVDIGSNSLRLLIADVVDSRILKLVHEERVITRLAEGLQQTGKLKTENINTSINVLIEFMKIIKKYSVRNYLFAATSAVREASNADQFLFKLDENGIKVNIITGKFEGELTFKGVNAVIDIKNCNSLIFDIGGGSTEFIYSEKDDIVFTESLDLGVVKLCNMFDFTHAVTDDLVRDVKLYIEKILKKVNFSGINPDKVIATAGTATTLAAIDMELEQYDYQKVNGYMLHISRIKAIFERIRKMNLPDRCNIKGLEKGREDTIIPGIIIIMAVMEKLNTKKLIISDFGLREGIVIAASDL